jgi:hypothetical protein
MPNNKSNKRWDEEAAFFDRVAVRQGQEVRI